MSVIGHLLEARHLLLVAGPGGVGKTTISAALGVVAAQDLDRRVAVITVDPARRLAGTLSGDGPESERPIGESFHAEMLDPAAAWDALIERELGAAAVERLSRNDMYRAVTRRFIQSHDFVAVERVHDLLEDDFDLVIVDTPPSGRALDFIDAPERMAQFFSLRSLGWLTGVASSGITDLTTRPFRLVADRVLGRRFVSDLLDFFSELSELSEGFALRAAAVADALRGPDTGVTLVTTGEPGPLRQLDALEQALRSAGLSPEAVIVNRMLRRLEPVAVEASTLAAETAPITGFDRTLLEEWARGALDGYEVARSDSRAEHDRVLEALPRAVARVRVDARPLPPVGVEALLDLGRSMLDGEVAGS